MTDAMLTPVENYRLAELYLDSGDPRSAVRLLEPLASGTFATTAVRLLLARAYFHSAQLRRAEQQFREVLDLDPTDHFAHFALGRTLERQSRLDEALRHFRLAAAMTASVEYEAAVTRLSQPLTAS